jgi:hypothetical protein
MRVKLCFLFFVFATCRAERKPPSPAVQKYLAEVVSILQANFINRASINWVVFKQQLLAEASGAQTIEQAHPAVESAIVALGDKHTQFYCARPLKAPPNGPCRAVPARPRRAGSGGHRLHLNSLGCRQPGKAGRVYNQRAGPNYRNRISGS